MIYSFFFLHYPKIKVSCCFHNFQVLFLILMCFLLTRRGKMEESQITRDMPIAKAAFSFLQDNVSSSFSSPAWNKGRIVCQRSQLKHILSGIVSSSDGSKKDRIINLSNSPFPSPGTRASISDLPSDQQNNVNSDATIARRAELLTSTV